MSESLNLLILNLTIKIHFCQSNTSVVNAQFCELCDFNMMKLLATLSLGLLILNNTYCQKVENAEIRQDGDDLVIVFDLMPRESIYELYDVIITAYDGNREKILKMKDQDASDVRPGNRLRFVIPGKENFQNFRGNVDFDIKVKMTYSPIRITAPVKRKKWIKGKSMDIKWRGGLEGERFTLELYKDFDHVSSIGTNVTSNEIKWDIPRDVKPGGKYAIRITSDSNNGNQVFSSEFKIRRKIPVVVKILPALLLGSVVAVLIGSSGKDEGFPNPPELPDPTN